jgi:hypothetical protein
MKIPMDKDRKYRQRGYMDSDRSDSKSNRNAADRTHQGGPRPPIDITGPRLPRLLQALAASRCYNCATALPKGIGFNGLCPKCRTVLHTAANSAPISSHPLASSASRQFPNELP